MSDFDKDKVLARVKKMMALANDAAATEGERDNALRMAHNTLAKYNLTMGQAEASGAASEEKRMDGAMSHKGDYPWMRTTAHAIAELFFCSYFFQRTGGTNIIYCFIGKESNIFTTIEMTKYVIASISKEGRAFAERNDERSGGNAWRSFCKGAAARVFQRCRDIRAAAEQQPVEMSSSTALVLASVYRQEKVANDHYLATVMNIRLRTGKGNQRNTSSDAYNAGKAFGDRIGLQKQIR